MRTQDLPIVDCPSDPRGRGRAHGEALRTVIALKVVRWQEAIAEAYGEPAESFLERFLRTTDFVPAIARHTPELLEEIAGIAEGAALPEQRALALQLMDEEWWFGRVLGPGHGAASAGRRRTLQPEHCSSLALAPEGGRPALLGQTMDLPRWHDGAQALLRLAEADGSETMVFTSAGLVGLMGVSGRGLGICVNTLIDLACDPRGLPVACAMRGALARPDAEAAAGFLAAVPHASGQTYQLGDARQVRCLECSAGGAVELPAPDGRCLHTNHPLASRDLRPEAKAGAGEAAGGADCHGADSHGADSHGADSRARLKSLRRDLAEAPAPDLETVRTALAATREEGAVSVDPGEEASPLASMSIGAVAYEIEPGAVTFSVAGGPPSREGWMRFRLRAAAAA